MSALLMPATEQMVMPETIERVVEKAASIIPHVFSMKNFIATNPLADMTEKSFEEAVTTAQNAFASTGVAQTNREVIKWCQQYFDDGQAAIKLPNRTSGFYQAWLELAIYDEILHQKDHKKKAWMRNLPKEADLALLFLLREHRVPQDEYESYLQRSLAQLPGWAGYCKNKYRTQNAAAPASLVDFLCVHLATSYLLGESIKNGTPAVSNWSFEEREADVRRELIRKLSTHTYSHNKAPDVQLVFCIDTRSEPFRRELEKLGKYETFGFAGFFGIPLRMYHSDRQEWKECCPVLIKPEHTVRSVPVPDTKKGKVKKSLRKLFVKLQEKLKYNVVTPFAYVETCGPIYGLWMLLRTIAPRLAYYAKNKSLQSKNALSVNLDSIPLNKQFHYAQSALRLIGLVDHFAPFVVLVSHGSCSENNPYFSSLDCGACGGNHGDVNAKALASILNNPQIRQMLALSGIVIPRTTKFLAALHNTTNDSLTLFDKPADSAIFNTLIKDLHSAKVKNCAQRGKKLDPDHSFEHGRQKTDKRCVDWSEVRPEWGLARCASFIAAPRSLTKDSDLDGRSFLHSYDWTIDHDGMLLETILTAPMVVAHWICNQYLFSTKDNQLYGSGSKVTHNVTGKVGVMQGNASDLQPGLPIQSVFLEDTKPYHEPLRLQVFVQAPRALLEKVIKSQKILQNLFYNGWVILTVLDPADGFQYLLQRDGSWRQEAA